ncbi:MAG: hypothetical protein LBU41_02280 [Clostridiales Family XIII bacterium]|jgi:hypothetical protein|nr:hypothetical protein [Clostridiales Family XIII bacterium]
MQNRKRFRYFEEELEEAASAAFFAVPGMVADRVSQKTQQEYLTKRRDQVGDGSIVSATVSQLGEYSFCFVLTAGTPPKGAGDYETLLMDLWANAYLEAAKRRLLQDGALFLQKSLAEKELVLRFDKLVTPGISDVPLSANAWIADVSGAEAMGVSVFESGTMMPLKTLASVAVYSPNLNPSPKANFCKKCKSLQGFTINPEGCMFCFGKADSFGA